MFSVNFNFEHFADFKTDVEACAVALDLHRISNVPHVIKVFSDNSDSPVLSLIVKED